MMHEQIWKQKMEGMSMDNLMRTKRLEEQQALFIEEMASLKAMILEQSKDLNLLEKQEQDIFDENLERAVQDMELPFPQEVTRFMSETDVHILCGCDAATTCPQGRHGADRQCVIVIPEDDLFRIVMQLPEFQRRYTVSEEQIEEQIQAKGLNAPRLRSEDIDVAIRTEDYYVFPGTTMTVCCLTLHNGFCVIGESAAASPENFDADIGRSIAKRNARDKIWALEGYLLKERLYQGEQTS